MKKVNLEKGETLFHENQESDVMYYVVSGEIEIFTIVNGEMLELDLVKEGDIFGEMGLLLNESRSATALAREYTVLAAISRAELFTRVQSDSAFALKMVQRLAHKLRTANRAIKEQLGEKRSLEIIYGGIQKAEVS